MADAASEWLDALDDEQCTEGTWPWPDEASQEERLRWFYTPTNHGGLPIARMLPAQQQMAMRLVATGLSESGFVTLLR